MIHHNACLLIALGHHRVWEYGWGLFADALDFVSTHGK